MAWVSAWTVVVAGSGPGGEKCWGKVSKKYNFGSPKIIVLRLVSLTVVVWCCPCGNVAPALGHQRPCSWNISKGIVGSSAITREVLSNLFSARSVQSLYTSPFPLLKMETFLLGGSYRDVMSLNEMISSWNSTEEIAI